MFCAAPLAAVAQREAVVHVGRTSRALIFAGALAVSPLACGPSVDYHVLPASAGARTTSGAIKGRILRHDGKPSPHHVVSLYGEQLRSFAQGRDSMNVQADATGYFVFENLPPGDYRMATHGLRDRPRIEVRTGYAAILTLELEPPPKPDPRHMAKPYGAPPARRRVV